MTGRLALDGAPEHVWGSEGIAAPDGRPPVPAPLGALLGVPSAATGSRVEASQETRGAQGAPGISRETV